MTPTELTKLLHAHTPNEALTLLLSTALRIVEAQRKGDILSNLVAGMHMLPLTSKAAKRRGKDKGRKRRKK